MGLRNHSEKADWHSTNLSDKAHTNIWHTSNHTDTVAAPPIGMEVYACDTLLIACITVGAVLVWATIETATVKQYQNKYIHLNFRGRFFVL